MHAHDISVPSLPHQDTHKHKSARSERHTHPDQHAQPRVDHVAELREQRARVVARLREALVWRVGALGVRARRRADGLRDGRQREVVDVVLRREARRGRLAQVVRVEVADGVVADRSLRTATQSSALGN